MRNLLLVIFMAIGASLTAQMKVQLELVPPVIKYIQCEPVQLDISWQNICDQKLYIGLPLKPTESGAFALIVDGKLYKQRLPGLGGFGMHKIAAAPEYLIPGGKKEDRYDLLYLNLEPGHHTIKAVADFRDLKRRPEGYFQGYAESNEVGFEILAPQGEDQEAVETMWEDLQKRRQVAGQGRAKMPLAEKCYFMLGSIGEKREILLKEFPTSIYGGYALLSALKGWHGLGWYSTPYENIAFYATLEKTKGLSKMFDNAVDGNEELIGMIEIFLKAGREDFPYTDDLRANLAGRLAIQGKFERAKSICEALIEKKSTQEKNCSEFLQHIREKGYLKD